MRSRRRGARARSARRSSSISMARPIRRTGARAAKPSCANGRRSRASAGTARPPTFAEVWRTHHVAMLLTWYREGVPRSLIEAAACGRPIVTTDAPGCRDLVRDRHEGMLVPLRDSEAAARALVELAERRRPAGAARAGGAGAVPGAFHRGRGAPCGGLRVCRVSSCNLLIQNVFGANRGLRSPAARAAC